MNTIKRFWRRMIQKFWAPIGKWINAVEKLYRIRKISSVYFNDSKFRKITEIIDEYN